MYDKQAFTIYLLAKLVTIYCPN